MSITDELRKFIEDPLLGYASQDQHIETLTEIADRIDAEYQKAEDELRAKNGDMWLKGYVECHEELMEGHPVIAADLEKAGWVRLPVDADGEYIHIGDVMEWPEDGETFEVVGIGDGWTLFYVIEDGVAEWTRAENKRHHQPDTWERIIEDARTCTGSAGNYTSVPSMRWTSEVDSLVARCRALAGDAS